MNKILEVNNLKTSFNTYAGEVQAVRGINFSLSKGETLAIVGESGCGKSVTAKSIMRLNPEPPAYYKEDGSVLFNGKNVLKLSQKEMMDIRGKDIGMIFQDPMTSLNPTMTIGAQITEGILRHQNITKHEAKNKALEMLGLVNIPDPEIRFNEYPHQFSGGMRQRAMIALALVCKPQILIADEPTTALDVTIQAQILELMIKLQKELNMAIILITHDLGVVADISDRIVVMYGGKIVESGTSRDIFYNSRHPYTWGLMSSVPRLDMKKEEESLFSIDGTPPDLLNPPEYCPFADRCDYAMKVCRDEMPPLFQVIEGHESACWLNHPDAPDLELPDIVTKNMSDKEELFNGK